MSPADIAATHRASVSTAELEAERPYREIMADVGMFWDANDAYGSLMCAWFPLAWVLQYEREGCPDEWRYRPGAVDSELEEDSTDLIYAEIYREAGTDTLLRVGEVFSRLYRRLEARGATY